MRRHLENAIAAIYLFLLLTTAVMWIRSYWRQDVFIIDRYRNLAIDTHPRVHELALVHGRGRYTFTQYDYFEYGDEPGCTWLTDETDDDGMSFFDGNGGKTWLGFGTITHHFRAAATGGGEKPDLTIQVVFPLWFLALALGVPAILLLPLLLLRNRRLKRSRLGLCRECGYNLRASTNICPECGASVNTDSKPSRITWTRRLLPFATAVITIAIAIGMTYSIAHHSFDHQRIKWKQFKDLKEALAQRDTARIESLLKAGAPATAKNLADTMWDSFGRNDEHLAILMLEAGADLTPRDRPLVITALSWGYCDLARRLVEMGVPLNQTGEDYGTALETLAASVGSENPADPRSMLAELMLKRGADPNISDNKGLTPLHALSLINANGPPSDVLRFAQVLLDHGAKIDAKDIRGKTPLHWAKSHECLDLERFLTSKGAKE